MILVFDLAQWVGSERRFVPSHSLKPGIFCTLVECIHFQYVSLLYTQGELIRRSNAQM